KAELILINQEPVNTQNLLFPKPLKLLIFLSRHKSESGRPTLSVHTPGNIGEASLGGIPRMVSVSPASAMKEALISMKKAQEEMNLKYEVSYECTHHGPSLDVPTIFVELGSSPTQWEDLDAAEAVARGALAAASTEKWYPTVLGVGGPHYNGKFTRKALRTEIAFSHIIPKYAVERLDVEMLRQCVKRTVEPVRKAILDWKGIKGADKNNLLENLLKVGLEFEKI
ncbi:TPA: D-tyrosyl-tRNA(Tyr) deacylase, partial [Candidatus Bathyarchaeota archaeon]|nr:D-tyrosyl-tRNA(Tyr) deacylase [Candidatus Bathyarchaeota archaeon]